MLRLQPDEEIAVHDPNDPRATIHCDLEEDPESVLVQWTCRYRDTGLVTTQTYRLVLMKQFLTTAFGQGE